MGKRYEENMYRKDHNSQAKRNKQNGEKWVWLRFFAFEERRVKCKFTKREEYILRVSNRVML